MDVDADKVVVCETPEAFWNWLSENHAEAKEVWLQLYKKQSGIPSINWSEAVVQAIAWGWIDGIKKSRDAQSWYQRFTPRRPKAMWSKKNREHAETLIADGRMQPAGQRLVDEAMENGHWDMAYAGSAEMEIPAEFLAALAKNPAAQQVFDGLNRANLFAIYYRLHAAKRPETRARRQSDIIAMLARGETFH